MQKNINQPAVLVLLAVLWGFLYVIFQLPLTSGSIFREHAPGARRPGADKVKISDDSMNGVVAVIRNRIDALG